MGWLKNRANKTGQSKFGVLTSSINPVNLVIKGTGKTVGIFNKKKGKQLLNWQSDNEKKIRNISYAVGGAAVGGLVGGGAIKGAGGLKAILSKVGGKTNKIKIGDRLKNGLQNRKANRLSKKENKAIDKALKQDNDKLNGIVDGHFPSGGDTNILKDGWERLRNKAMDWGADQVSDWQKTDAGEKFSKDTFIQYIKDNWKNILLYFALPFGGVIALMVFISRNKLKSNSKKKWKK
jgi:hypothetical protein